MNKFDLKQYINELQQADVTITHAKSETILSYNGLDDPAQLNAKILQLSFNTVDIINNCIDSPKLLNFLDHFASSYQKHINHFFPIINNHVTTRSLYINHNLNGHILFKNLDEDLQQKISEFAKIQRDHFLLFIDILRTSEDEAPKNNYPYNYNSQTTDLVTILMSLFASNYFIPAKEQSPNKLSTFINLTCDQLNIPRISNLSSVISNVKKKASPDQTLQELAKNLLKME